MEELEQRLLKAERLSRICEKVGFAVWQLQALEDVVAKCLIMLTYPKGGLSEDEAVLVLEKAQRRTLGSMLGAIREADFLPQELEQRLLDLLQDRNWLVHQSRIKSRDAVLSDEAFEKLRLRLEALVEENTKVMHALTDITIELVKLYGVTPASLEPKAQELLRRLSVDC